MFVVALIGDVGGSPALRPGNSGCMRGRSVLWVLAPAVPLAIAALVLIGPANKVADLTRDMAATAGIPPWVGFLSFVGVVYWTSAGAIAVFASFHCLPRDRRPLMTLGTLLVVLGLDDLFMVHEDVLPSLGVPEDLPKVAYVVAVAAFVFAFHAHFVGLDRTIGLVALGALAASLGIDFVTNGGNLSSAVEDLLKFAGITLLLWLAVRLSSAAIERARPPASLNEARGQTTRSGLGY